MFPRTGRWSGLTGSRATLRSQSHPAPLRRLSTEAVFRRPVALIGLADFRPVILVMFPEGRLRLPGLPSLGLRGGNTALRTARAEHQGKTQGDEQNMFH